MSKPLSTSLRHSRRGRLVLVAVPLAALVALSLRGLDQHGVGRTPSTSADAPLVVEPLVHRRHDRLPGRPPARSALGVADGEVPAGTTPFDDVPAVDNLDHALLTALRDAARDASEDDVVVEVNSGWRSRAYQERLLDEAVARYGSRAEAARWVATPDTSPHVSGDAVDLGPADATRWLAAHGAAYGLCRIYRNEPWHFELRPAAVDDGCPAPYADPTHDPRMRP